ncbi:23S rRNA (guanosine(2251)-2'-O)-methyltransferase RlmB [Nitrosophilus alvini]|uniref:23S rRNA (guanosine(2251)-2'-O)-methyltransferase RlmB n=1 Tax=Nitrosophilus alvini TaxID=2714855 RepID=UPI00190E03FE|nr:23S rRNA (guanosine(2251)-2'-O)-methyltransferase RlmB [Nitrosophilus alvini]
MIVYGKQIIAYILEKHRHLLKKVYLAKDIDPKIFSKIKKSGAPVIKVDPKKAQALAKGGNHQGFLAEIEDFEFKDIATVKTGDFVAVLYSITDVGNIGSIVRTAYALGVDGVVISGIKNVNMEGVIRASSAAALDMDIALCPNIYDLLNELKQSGFCVYSASMEGEDVRKVTFAPKKVLILGSEGEGLPARVCKRSDRLLSIKMKREFDSLNVSAAAAILIDRMRDE